MVAGNSITKGTFTWKPSMRHVNNAADSAVLSRKQCNECS